MNHSTKPPPSHPLVVVAGLCGLASVSIVALVFCLRRDISGTEMWAVAAMAAAPSFMGVAMAYFMTKPAPRVVPPSA